MFLCPGRTVGFGVLFFVSGLYKFMGKLADRISFWCPGPAGVGFGGPGHRKMFYLLVLP